MQIAILEATNGPQNWGKFMVGRFLQAEWNVQSAVAREAGLNRALLGQCGWTPENVLVFDLQTGEGAMFLPRPKSPHCATYDLDKHRIWVCPLFEPFLEWLYQQDLSDLRRLPKSIDLPHAEFALSGYRRPGPQV